MDDPVDWEGYRFLSNLIEHGGLQKAARFHGISRSTAGRKIKRLEQQLGTRIVNRTPEGYSLTETGHYVAIRAEAMAQQAKEILQDVRGTDQRLEGPVTVTLTEAMAELILLPALVEFRERYPQIELELLLSNEKLDLGRQEADIAIRVGDPGPATLVGSIVGEMTYGLYGAECYLREKNWPRSIEMLSSCALIHASGEIADAPQARHLRRLAPNAPTGLYCNSIMAQHRAMLEGLGLAALPAYVAAQGQSSCRRVLEQEFAGVSDVWLLTNSNVLQTLRVRTVMNFLKKLLRKKLKRSAEKPIESESDQV
ncbi:MAG: LysR family transcriptional regulator [Geminicoccaceae bacterium]